MSRRCPFCGRLVSFTDHFPCAYQPDRDPDPLGGLAADINSNERNERITFRLPETLTDEIEELVDAGAYANRSEAIRASLLETFAAPPDPDDVSEEVEHKMVTDGGVATDQSNADVKPIRPTACDERRWAVITANNLREVADDRSRLSKSNLGKHVRGECLCSATLPPLTNKGYGSGCQWKFDNQQPPECPECDRTTHVETVGLGWVCVSCHITFEPSELFDAGWPAESPAEGGR